MRVAIYDTATGAISRHVSAPAHLITSQVNEGEDFYLNCPDTATHIKNSEPVNIPVELSPQDRMERIRLNRDLLLKGCDWTQTTDSPLSTDQRSMWVIYRQLLRDFPSVCDPFNPVWPEPPK